MTLIDIFLVFGSVFLEKELLFQKKFKLKLFFSLIIMRGHLNLI